MVSAGTCSLEFSGIRIGPDEVAMVDSGRKFLVIPRDKIQSVELRYCAPSTRPLLMLLVGAGVILLGLCPIVFIPAWAETHAGKIPAVAFTWFVWVIPGIWIVSESLRKRHHLLIRAGRKPYILPFERKVDPGLLIVFVERARKELGLDIIITPSSFRS